MSILLDKNTRVLVQGITGRDGSFHAKQMIEYGTTVVGGVTPGKGGQEIHGVPVFDTMKDAVAATKANASVIYVPAKFAPGAIMDAADAGIQLIVAITEGIPVRDMLILRNKMLAKEAAGGKKTLLLGPNGPGLITPEGCTAPLAVVGRASNRPAPHIKAAPLTRRRAACLPRKMFCISSTLGLFVTFTVRVISTARRTPLVGDLERMPALFIFVQGFFGGTSVMYLHLQPQKGTSS